MAKRPVRDLLYFGQAPSDEELNPFAIPLGPSAQRATGRRTMAAKKGDQPRKIAKPTIGDYASTLGHMALAVPRISQTGYDLGASIAKALPDALSRFSVGDVLPAAVQGIRNYADYASNDKANALADFSVVGAGRDFLHDFQRAAELRASGQYGSAADIEKLALPFLAMGVLPGGGKARAAERAGREGLEEAASLAAREVPSLAALSDIRAPRENLQQVLNANTEMGRIRGERLRPISEISGGPSLSADDRRRVETLKTAMASPSGYVERLIVDDAGNLIEGAHRLEALRQLGATHVPVVEIQDFSRDFPAQEIKAAVSGAQDLHPDHVNQIASHLAEAFADEGGDVSRIVEDYDPPRGYESAWQAGLDALQKSREPAPLAVQSVPASPRTEPSLAAREGEQAAESLAAREAPSLAAREGSRELIGAETPFMVSTRRPTPPNYATQGNPDERLLVQTGDALRAAPAAFEKNMGLLAEEPFMRGLAGSSAEDIYSEGLRRGADNLKFIMNELMPSSQVAAAKEWYPTANLVSERAAQRAGLPAQAGYGVTAVTSPQTPWDVNVARLDRLMDMYGDRFSVDPKDAARWAEARMADKPGAVAGRGLDYVERVAKTPYEELQDPFDRFARVVMADATRNNPTVPKIDLSGAYGSPYGPMTWGSSTEINKALNILDDPTMETINAQLLGGGKVPSFYNNIANPNSSAPITTIDTHSAGAASLYPGGGKDTIVYRGMGLGRPTPEYPPAASDVARTGAKGLYGPLADMHALAGAEMGMLPREVQSATWEGVRDLWGQSGKTAKLKQTIADIWRTSSSPDEARFRVAEVLGRPVKRPFQVK